MKFNYIRLDQMTLQAERRGGPYSKSEKNKRRNEVHRLHFEYGYSARKISDLMKINRNTINRDLQYLYYQLGKELLVINPHHTMAIISRRFEIQRTRLREQLDKAITLKEKMPIEKLIFDIDSKVLVTNQKIVDSKIMREIEDTDKLNEWLKKNNKDERCLKFFDKIRVSQKAYERINNILKEDDRKITF